MKAPATTQFPSDGLNTAPLAVYYPEKNETRLFGLISYDSENSYGALLRGSALVTYKCAGNASTQPEPIYWIDDTTGLP